MELAVDPGGAVEAALDSGGVVKAALDPGGVVKVALVSGGDVKAALDSGGAVKAALDPGGNAKAALEDPGGVVELDSAAQVAKKTAEIEKQKDRDKGALKSIKPSLTHFETQNLPIYDENVGWRKKAVHLESLVEQLVNVVKLEGSVERCSVEPVERCSVESVEQGKDPDGKAESTSAAECLAKRKRRTRTLEE